MTDSTPQPRAKATVPAAPVDEIDELLGESVVFSRGEAPPEESVFQVPLERRAESGVVPDIRESPELPVSPVFWAAAIVWNVVGGLGGWLMLRRTHPRTARLLLIVGCVSFAVIAILAGAGLLAYRAANPSHIVIHGGVAPAGPTGQGGM